MRKTKNLKFKRILPIALILFFFTCVFAFGSDRVEVPLTNPAKPALVKVSIMKGSIFVKGTSGKQVIVEAKVLPKKKGEFEEEKKEVDKKAKGMKLIKTSGTGLEVEEENNVVKVRTMSMGNGVEVVIHVPYSTSLNIRANMGDVVEVTNVSGDLEANNMTGPVKMTGVGGSVVAHSMTGAVTVVFDKINLTKPMSFSSMSGDIDVTFPKNLKANVKMNTAQGEIYSDFNIQVTPGPGKVIKKKKEKNGKFKVVFDRTQYGTINGGGEEISFKTMTGSIYIRAKK